MKSPMVKTVLAIVAGLVLAACGQSDDSQAVMDDEAGADVDVDDFMPDADLEELGHASDLVVRGPVTAAEDDVQIGEDEGLGYTVFTITAEESLHGDAPDTVDVAMTTEIDGSEAAFEGRPDAQEGTDAVWFSQRSDLSSNKKDTYSPTSRG